MYKSIQRPGGETCSFFLVFLFFKFHIITGKPINFEGARGEEGADLCIGEKN